MTIKQEVLKEYMKTLWDEKDSVKQVAKMDAKEVIDITLKKVEEVIDKQIFQMEDFYRIIKNKKGLSEHDRGWENCSIFLKELKKELKK